MEKASGVKLLLLFGVAVLYSCDPGGGGIVVPPHDPNPDPDMVTETGTAPGEVYVANSNNTISVFDSSLSGNAKALRQFGNVTGISDPSGIAVDTVHNEMFVVNRDNNSITVYGRTDSGNTAPVRTISGLNTRLWIPHGIAVDTINNEIFVVNNLTDSITVYGRTDSGNVTPVRTISGASTGLREPSGIAVDTVNRRYLLLTSATQSLYMAGRTPVMFHREEPFPAQALAWAYNLALPWTR